MTFLSVTWEDAIETLRWYRKYKLKEEGKEDEKDRNRK